MKEIQYHKIEGKNPMPTSLSFGVKFCTNEKINMHFVAHTLFMGNF
jgi:hypothetical protein